MSDFVLGSGLFRDCLIVVAHRGLFFAVLNLVFFGSLFVSVLLTSLGDLPVSLGVSSFVVGDPLLLGLETFFFNLFVSAFVVVTLSGFVFFVVSPLVLVFRAFLWGVLLSRLSTSEFLAVLPTLVIEGEAYVLASVAGVVLGLSWLRPRWVYGEDDLGRVEALKRAFRECRWIYVWVVLLLAVAAVLEVVTLHIVKFS